MKGIYLLFLNTKRQVWIIIINEDILKNIVLVYDGSGGWGDGGWGAHRITYKIAKKWCFINTWLVKSKNAGVIIFCIYISETCMLMNIVSNIWYLIKIWYSLTGLCG